MRFGAINYLNLLPFVIFYKRLALPHGAKASFAYKQGVPSAINKAFRQGKIDAAFISSVISKPYRCLDVGIVAHKRIYSVLILPHQSGLDPASQSSNALANLLGLEGRVLIGDEALRYFLSHDDAIDLAHEWYKRYRLPFVFARLCYHRGAKRYTKALKRFGKHPPKIPHYILKKEAQKRGLKPSQIKAYLKEVTYPIDHKAKRGLKHFLKWCRE